MKTITSEQVISLLKEKAKEHGSQFKAAIALDISPAYYGDIIAGKRLVSDAIARKLGYRKVVVYQKEEKE